jgi:hypothetical protein
MPRSARASLAVALLLAACSTAAPSPTGDPHAGHSSDASGAVGTPHPSVPEGADGSIELENDFATGGTGASVAQALEVTSSQPMLLTGILVRDAAGGIWFCDAIDEGDAPGCGRPRLWVTGFPADQAVFAPENAGNTGAQTAGGVTWIPGQQLFGVVHPAP